jgi:hypothetical protein
MYSYSTPYMCGRDPDGIMQVMMEYNGGVRGKDMEYLMDGTCRLIAPTGSSIALPRTVTLTRVLLRTTPVRGLLQILRTPSS